MAPQGRQSPTHYGYVGPSDRYDCSKCIRTYGENRGFPDLPLRYAEAWQLFLTLYDQQRVGMEAIGLDYAVLPAVFDLYGIPHDERQARFEELVVLNHAMQAHNAQEREQRQRDAKAHSAMRGR